MQQAAAQFHPPKPTTRNQIQQFIRNLAVAAASPGILADMKELALFIVFVIWTSHPGAGLVEAGINGKHKCVSLRILGVKIIDVHHAEPKSN